MVPNKTKLFSQRLALVGNVDNGVDALRVFYLSALDRREKHYQIYNNVRLSKSLEGTAYSILPQYKGSAEGGVLNPHKGMVFPNMMC